MSYQSYRPSTAEVIDLVSSDDEPEAPIIDDTQWVPRKRTAPRPSAQLNATITNSDEEEEDSAQPKRKRTRVPIDGTVKFEPFLFGEADTDEITEVYKPCDAVPVANNVSNNDDDDDDDIMVVDAGNTVNAMAMPHSREDCIVMRYTRPASGTNAGNHLHCPMCFCYVCEVKVAECTDWIRHCDATYRDSCWKTEKGYSSNKLFPLLSPDEKKLFMTVFESNFFMANRHNDVRSTVQVLQNMWKASSRQPPILSIIIIISVFQHGPGRMSHWGQSESPGNIPRYMMAMFQCLGNVLCGSSAECDLRVLRVLAEEVQTSTFADRLPRIVLPFLFKFLYAYRHKQASIKCEPDNLSVSDADTCLQIFNSCVTASRWERTDLTRRPTTHASVGEDVAVVLSDIFKNSEPAMSNLSGYIWPYTSAETQIHGMSALLASVKTETDVENLFLVAQAALKAGSLHNESIGLKSITSAKSLFVLFGIVYHAKPVTSGHRQQLLRQILVRLFTLVYTDSKLLPIVKFYDPDGLPNGTPDSADVKSFLKIRSELMTDCKPWMGVFNRAVEEDSRTDNGGNKQVVLLVVKLIQYLPTVADLYSYSTAPFPDTGLGILLQRRVLSAYSALSNIIEGADSYNRIELKNRVLFDIAKMLLTMKMAVLYAGGDGTSVQPVVATKLEYFRELMKGFHEISFRLIPRRPEYLPVYPVPILLSAIHIPADSQFGDVFSTSSCSRKLATGAGLAVTASSRSNNNSNSSSSSSSSSSDSSDSSDISSSITCEYCRLQGERKDNAADLSIDMLLDENDPATFSSDHLDGHKVNDLYFNTTTDTPSILLGVNINSALFTKIKNFTVNEYIMTVLVRSIFQGTITANGSFIDELYDHSSSGRYTITPGFFVHKRETFSSDLDYCKYLFVKIYEGLFLAMCIDNVGEIIVLVRWTRETSYYIDSILSRCLWKSYGESCSKSCWSYWSSYIWNTWRLQKMPTNFGICEIFLLDTPGDAFLSVVLSDKRRVQLFFNKLNHVRLSDLVPPAVMNISTALTPEECKYHAHRLERVMTVISSARESSLENYKSGIVTLCSSGSSFFMDLFARKDGDATSSSYSHSAVPNENMYAACLEVFAQSAVANRSVSMIRLFSNWNANAWLTERYKCNRPPQRESTDSGHLDLILRHNSVEWMGSLILKKHIRQLLYGDLIASDADAPMGTSTSQCIFPSPSSKGNSQESEFGSVNGSPIASSSGAKIIGTKSETCCKWPNLREHQLSFVFVNMAEIKNVSKCEIILMLVYLGDFETIKKMFRSWYGMSRATQRSNFDKVAHRAVMANRSPSEASDTSELFMQMLLMAQGLPQRHVIMSKCRHWIKWHFLCTNVEKYAHPHLAESITDLAEVAIEEATKAGGVITRPELEQQASFLELSFYGKPSCEALQRYISKRLQVTAAGTAFLTMDRLKQCFVGKAEHSVLTPQDLVAAFPIVNCTGADTELLNDDVAFTIIHHLLQGDSPGRNMTACIMFFSARQLKLLTESVSKDNFAMNPVIFYAVSMNFCRFLLWCAHWLSKPTADMLARWIMSFLLDILVRTSWTASWPIITLDLTFIKNTFLEYESISNWGLIITSRKEMFCDICLTPDEKLETPIAGVGMIPFSLRDLAVDSVLETDISIRKTALLRFIATDPTVEGFRGTDMTFLSDVHVENVMRLLPSSIKLSLHALKHDFKELWAVFIYDQDGNELPNNISNVDVMSRRLKDVTECMHESWFMAKGGEESDHNYVMFFLKEFCFNLVCNLFFLKTRYLADGRFHEADAAVVPLSLIHSFFEKLVAVLRINVDMSWAISVLVMLSQNMSHDAISTFLVASAKHGCRAYGIESDFHAIFFKLKQLGHYGTPEWRAYVFAGLIGFDPTLDALAADIFYLSATGRRGVKESLSLEKDPLREDVLKHLEYAVEKGGLKAAVELEEYVVMSLLEMKNCPAPHSVRSSYQLLENRSFVNLLTAMSAHIPYMVHIATLGRDSFDFNAFFGPTATIHAIPWLKHDQQTHVPSTYLADIGYKLGLIHLSEVQQSSRAVTYSKLLLCAADSEIIRKCFLNFRTQIGASYDIGMLDALCSGQLTDAQLKSLVVYEEIQYVILALPSSTLLEYAVSLRNVWAQAVDTERDSCRVFVERCFSKAASFLLTTTANAARKAILTAMLNMIRQDYFESRRNDGSANYPWINYCYCLSSELKSKPLLKKLVVKVLFNQ